MKPHAEQIAQSGKNVIGNDHPRKGVLLLRILRLEIQAPINLRVRLHIRLSYYIVVNVDVVEISAGRTEIIMEEERFTDVLKPVAIHSDVAISDLENIGMLVRLLSFISAVLIGS